MSRPSKPSPAPGTRAGLCDTCLHQQQVRNTRGSTFSLCKRSRTDPAYPRYPRLPVLACRGYETSTLLGTLPEGGQAGER